MFEETFAAQNTREDMRVYLASAFNNARQPLGRGCQLLAFGVIRSR
jgi:hypothetical protein